MIKKTLLILGSLLLIAGLAAYLVTGSGSFRRMVTISGIYAVCRPDGYDVVCFLDADSSQGGLFCVPLSKLDGKCKK